MQGFGEDRTKYGGHLCRDLEKPAQIVQGCVKACTDFAEIWKSLHKIYRSNWKNAIHMKRPISDYPC